MSSTTATTSRAVATLDPDRAHNAARLARAPAGLARIAEPSNGTARMRRMVEDEGFVPRLHGASVHLARLIPAVLLALAVAGCGPDGTSGTRTSSGAPSTARASPGAQQSPAPVLEAGLPFTRDGLTVTVAEPATATFRAGGRVVQLTVQVTAVNTSGAAVALPAEFGLVCRNSPNTNNVKNVSEAFPDSTVKPGALVPAGQTTTGALVMRWVADAANPTQLTTCRGGGSIIARAPGAGDLASWIVPPDVIRTGNALVDHGGTLA